MSSWRAAAEVFGTSAQHQIALVRVHPLFAIYGALMPAALLLVMFYTRGRPSGEQVTAVATAVMLMAYWGSTVWLGAVILVRERNAGTLGAFMRGVRDPMFVLTGRSFGASVAPALLSAATVWVTVVALGERLVVDDVTWFAVGLVAALVSGTALGTVLSSLFLLTRYGAQLASALLYPVFLLAGLLIPPDLFPAAVRWLGWFVSLRWAQEFLVSSAAGSPDFTALGLVGLLTVGYAVAGVAAFRRIDTLVRRRGTLELG